METLQENHNSDQSKTGDFPCVSCHTDCCKEYVIFVNAHDVYRLSLGLNLAPETFLEIYGAKDYSLGIKVKEGLIDLALKQKNGGCEFLEESKDVFRCTVNDFKPGVCKSYPFAMKNGKLIQMANIMCPVDWDLAEFEKMMVNHLKKDEHEWKFYDSLVKEWNTKHSHKKPLSEFLKFMLDKVEFSLTS
ncbi:MAG: YkgJ family cysteine cluster protein [Nitrosopumilus sp.]|nr:YkgJ family cysteine cluster protein [Nitrosopumilus sp.]NNL37054.1 YkgJ family cysteine cluster protein [Nitrosopumilus sp.]